MFKKSKGIVGTLVTAFVLVPIVLAISFLVYTGINNGIGTTQFTAQSLNNTSSMNATPATFQTSFPAFSGSVRNLVVKNGSTTLTTPAMYNATITDGGTTNATVSIVFVPASGNLTSVKADYNGYDTYSVNQISTVQSVDSNTQTGFKLGANLPTVLAAGAIIGVITAAFLVMK